MITKSDFIKGPFVIVVSQRDYEEQVCVIDFPESFNTQEEAETFIQSLHVDYSNGLDFKIVPKWTPHVFVAWASF